MIIQIVALIVLFVIAVEDIKSMNISSWKIWILAALSVGSAVFEVAMGSYDIESAAVALLPGEIWK